MQCPQWVQQSGQQINCQSQSNINTIMQNAKVKVQFMQYEINPKNFDLPVFPSLKTFTVNLLNANNNSNTGTLLQFYFQETVLSTDQGWILEDYKDQQINSYYTYQENQLDNATSSLLTMEIYIYSQKHFVERTYSKIQVYLAYIGGIIKMLMILGEFVTRPFVRLSLSIKIVNEVFDFEGGESEGGSTDILSYEELYHVPKIQQNENQFQRGSSIQSLAIQKSFSPTTFEGMANSYLKNERPPQLFKNNIDQIEPYNQTTSLIKIQKAEQNNVDNKGMIEKNRSRNISIIHEHHNDNHSVSTPQHYNRQSRDISPMISALGLKKLSQNGSSNKQSKTSLDENTFVNQQKLNQIQSYVLNKEEASQFDRIQNVKQTFQPINIIGQIQIHNNKSKEASISQQNYETPKLPFNNQRHNSCSSQQSSSSSSSSSQSSSSQSQSQQSSQRSKNGQSKNRNKKLSNSLPSTPKLNQLVKTQVPSPSYAQHKSDRLNFRSKKQEEGFQLADQVGNQQTRQSQKITGDIEEMINTPNCIKLVSQQIVQSNQIIKNKQNQQITLSVDTNLPKPISNQFLSLNEQQITSKRSKSILKNGNSITIRHSYSIGEHNQESSPQIPEEYSPQRKNNLSITFCKTEKQSNYNDEKSPQKSDYGSQRLSPDYRTRFSAISSPERDSNYSPQNKQHVIKNISFQPQPQSIIKPFNLIERRSQSVLGISKLKGFKIAENNSFNPNDSQNITHLQNQERDNIRTRNSSQAQQQMQINMHRHSSKRLSLIDQQRILAASKLMANFQNHLETPVEALKDYGKLAHSPKKKLKNADSIFKKLVRQGKVLKMQFFDYFTFYLQCFKSIYSEKKKQIKYSKERVKERLDVVYIMQKLVEIDKLKMLVLNEDQIKLFEYLPKPIVHLNPKEVPPSPSLKNSNKPSPNSHLHHPQNMQQAWSMLHQQKNPIEKAAEASEVYKNMIENDPEQLTSIDRKLLEMMDVRVKNIFENKIINQRQKNQAQIEMNNSVLLNRINTDQINMSINDNNVTKDNCNETQNLFLDPQQQQNKTNNSQILEKYTNQNLKSLDEIPFNKTEEYGIQSNKNQNSTKNLKNLFLYEVQQSLKKIDEESDQVKRQNSINSSQKQQEQVINQSLWNQNMYSSKENQLKKTERVV
ncbi:transmembrane protein, putative (macronuclear) [Tetrahymena thermophila SB210]|uniref:Transmembrane protein, putative n=1 Tax=Tetrahymena thermophila (strain SB210) TaxID=312017 RepID=I7MHL6_TETTS|nr:transmembrane protein, putative [Tetrahymena thermophila SB210]EAS03086.2 transmembrane protein, putative [Tetrahymena thermophila SB210]|eukprot:XP_001023331.2 transmembrane protein, putative [Tetrahymena thermophila SB210]